MAGLVFSSEAAKAANAAYAPILNAQRTAQDAAAVAATRAWLAAHGSNAGNAGQMDADAAAPGVFAMGAPPAPDAAATEDQGRQRQWRQQLMASRREQRAAADAASQKLQRERDDQRREALKRKRAAEEARAAAAIGAQGSGLLALKAIAIKTRLEIYNTASENLYPILMLSTRELETGEPADFAGVTLNDIFTKRLSVVCDMVFGSDVRKLLATRFTTASGSPNIRNFFELEDPGEQCGNTIGARDLDSPCWLCLLRLGLSAQKHNCEHKLPLLPALLLTGLYDRNLHAFLVRSNRAAQYKELVQLEYGWAHERCNQLKTDIVFIAPNVNAQTKVVTFSTNDGTIDPYVIQNFTARQYESSYTPTLAQMEDAVRLEGLDIPRAQQRSKDGIRAGLRVLVDRLNAKQLTSRQLMSHFIRGLTNRVVALAPDQARDMRARFPEQIAKVEARLRGRVGGSGRKQTRRRRRGTYRKQRGGDDDAEADDLITQYIFDRVKERMFPKLDKTTFEALAEDVLETGPSEYLFQALEAFVNETDDIAFDIAGDPAIPNNIDAFETWLNGKLASIGQGAAAAMVEEAAPPAAPLAVDTSPRPAPSTLASTLPTSTASQIDDGLMSGDESQMSQPGTPPRRSTGYATELASLLSPQKGGFKFTMGTRPDWL